MGPSSSSSSSLCHSCWWAIFFGIALVLGITALPVAHASLTDDDDSGTYTPILVLAKESRRVQNYDTRATAIHTHSPNDVLLGLTEFFVQPNCSLSEPLTRRSVSMRYVVHGQLTSWNANDGKYTTLASGSVQTASNTRAVTRDMNRNHDSVLHFVDLMFAPCADGSGVELPFVTYALPPTSNRNTLRLLASSVAWNEYIEHSTVPFDADPQGPHAALHSRAAFWPSELDRPADLFQDVYVHDCVLEAQQVVKFRMRPSRTYMIYMLSDLGSDPGASVTISNIQTPLTLTSGQTCYFKFYLQEVIALQGVSKESHFLLLDLPPHATISSDESLLYQWIKARPTPTPIPEPRAAATVLEDDGLLEGEFE
jgi:hypothetical protein